MNAVINSIRVKNRNYPATLHNASADVLGDLAKLEITPNPGSLKPNGVLERTMISPGRNQSKALKLFRAIKNLPIIDPHTHYDSKGIAANTSFQDPTMLFLGVPGMGFDHYAATEMRKAGYPEEIVCGRKTKNDPAPSIEFNKKRFEALVISLCENEPCPSYQWMAIALEEVLGIKTPLRPENANKIWKEALAKLKDHNFKPQAMLEKAGVKIALTTDDPTADLAEHKDINSKSKKIRLLPTWRPDGVLMIEGSQRFDFNPWVNKLETAADMQIKTIGDFKEALRKRMDHFAEHGCIACDIGLVNFEDKPATKKEIKNIFEKARKGKKLSDSEIKKWKTHMLRWLCKQNAKRQWAQYFHRGPARDLNQKYFQDQGPDSGGDAPGEALNRKAFTATLKYLSSLKVAESLDGSGLAPTIFFDINSEDYRYLIDTINRFQGNEAGVKNKLQIGPPWWFNDTNQVNSEVIKLVSERGSIKKWIGMLSDARCLPSVIARMKQWRAILANELVEMFPDKSEKDLIKIAADLSVRNVAKFLRINEPERARTIAQLAKK